MGKIPNDAMVAGGGGGVIERLDWFSNVIWRYTINTDTSRLHHDFEILPNNNLLLMVWVSRTAEKAIEQGRNPDSLSSEFLWTEKIIEIEPSGTNDFNIVWEWDLWDHLIQDYDPTKANFGVVSENPQLMNINYNSFSGIADWAHGNSISYHHQLDQIIISMRDFNEFWIVDHSTTTTEASGHSGGNGNMGGDILFRWGNDDTYFNERATQTSFRQHSVNWADKTSDDEFQNIIFFNNGDNNRPYSTIDLVGIDTDESMYSKNSNGRFQAVQTVIYESEISEEFFASFLSSVQLLDNGNLFICDGPHGRLFELNEESIVWEYVNPITPNGIATVDFEFKSKEDLAENWVFSSYKYHENYLNGVPFISAESTTTIDNENINSIRCSALNNNNSGVIISPVPLNGQGIFRVFSEVDIESISIYTLHGQLIYQDQPKVEILELNLGLMPGNYVIQINNESRFLNVY